MSCTLVANLDQVDSQVDRQADIKWKDPLQFKNTCILFCDDITNS